MLLRVSDLNNVNKDSLEKFFVECRRLGYENNTSLSAIGIDLVKGRNGNIWFLSKGDEIIGMAGCHKFDEHDPTSFRIQFRGCELPGTDVKPGLSRSHFNSSTFRGLIPYQLKWIEDLGYNKDNVYLTVNRGHKNYRAMSLIEKQGFLSNPKDMVLFGVDQTVWKFNTLHYEEVRKKVTSYVV